MLSKLLKHEFRATARVMLPVYLVILVLALGTRLTNVWSNAVTYEGLMGWDPVAVLMILLSVGFFVALIAVFVVTLVLMISRFKSNLLSDEGYVMFTLPVSAHQLVWSKLIVSAVWFLGAVAVDGLALLVVAANRDLFSGLFQSFQSMFSQITAYYAANGLLALAELLVLVLLLCFVQCLRFYAPMAIGHSFARHKTLLSVAFFFVILVAAQFAATLLLTAGVPFLGEASTPLLDLSPAGLFHGTMWAMILVEAVYGAILYCLTIRMLHRHLNLE